MRKISCMLMVLLLVTSCGRRVPPPSAEEQMLRLRRFERLLYDGVMELRKGSDEALALAEAKFLLAAELSSNNPRAHDGLGAIAWRRGLLIDAERHFKNAIAADGRYARGYVHLARLAHAAGRVDEARTLLEEALALNPLDYRGRNDYAVLLYELAGSEPERAAAFKELLKAISEAPSDDPVPARNRKGMTVAQARQ